MSQRIRHLVICIPLAASAMGCSTNTDAATPSTTRASALKTLPCGFSPPGLKEGTNLSCATVQRGTVTLFVTMIGDAGTPVKREPIMHLQGGPGASSEAYAPILTGTYLALAKATDRLVVFVDQRGSGRSKPFLTCKDPSNSVACSDELTSHGIDLKNFTTVQAADDIDAVAQALGADQVNLWGASYGSRLALEVTRRHPDLVRSLLIESVDTADTPLRAVAGVRGALQRINADCATDSACAGLKVDLNTDVDALATALATKPVVTSIGPLEAAGFISTTLSLMQDSQGKSLVPLWVHAVRMGDVKNIEAIVTKSMDEPALGGQFSAVMNIITNCADMAAFKPQVAVANLASETKSPLGAALVAQMDGQYAAGCKSWPVAVDGPTEAVTSDVPTLIYNGIDDSNTPLENAQLAAATLLKATVVKWPRYGHFPFHRGDNPCAASIYGRFLNKPSATVDTTCVSPGKFVTTTSNTSEVAALE